MIGLTGEFSEVWQGKELGDPFRQGRNLRSTRPPRRTRSPARPGQAGFAFPATGPSWVPPGCANRTLIGGCSVWRVVSGGRLLGSAKPSGAQRSRFAPRQGRGRRGELVPEWEELVCTPCVLVRVRNNGDKSGQRTCLEVRPEWKGAGVRPGKESRGRRGCMAANTGKNSRK